MMRSSHWRYMGLDPDGENCPMIYLIETVAVITDIGSYRLRMSCPIVCMLTLNLPLPNPRSRLTALDPDHRWVAIIIFLPLPLSPAVLLNQLQEQCHIVGRSTKHTGVT